MARAPKMIPDQATKPSVWHKKQLTKLHRKLQRSWVSCSWTISSFNSIQSFSTEEGSNLQVMNMIQLQPVESKSSCDQNGLNSQAERPCRFLPGTAPKMQSSSTSQHCADTRLGAASNPMAIGTCKINRHVCIVYVSIYVYIFNVPISKKQVQKQKPVPNQNKLWWYPQQQFLVPRLTTWAPFFCSVVLPMWTMSSPKGVPNNHMAAPVKVARQQTTP